MIKLIAIFTMLIDHIGYFFFPAQIWIRCIGRISMPLFAYGIAKGFLVSMERGTFYKYLIRMFMFSLISQIPYMLSFGYTLNIGFTWLLALIVLLTWTKAKDSKHIYIALIFELLIIVVFLPVDYGIYGVFMPILFYEFGIKRNEPYRLGLSMTILWIFYLAITGYNNYSWVQFFAVLSLPIIYLVKPIDNLVWLPKWFTYLFYPVHLILFVLIQIAVIN